MAYRCGGCNRRWRGQDDWNATMKAGEITGVTCPRCQTPEQNAEAEINEATLAYERGPDGRFRGYPKQ